MKKSLLASSLMIALGAISAPALAANTLGIQDEVMTQSHSETQAQHVKASNVLDAELAYSEGTLPITDLRLKQNGEVDALIVSYGGFFGLFGEEVAIENVAARIEPQGDDINVRAEMLTEADFETATNGDGWRPVGLELDNDKDGDALYFSTLEGAAVKNAADETVAVVTDLYLSTDGTITGVEVASNRFSALTGEKAEMALSDIDMTYVQDEGWSFTTTKTKADLGFEAEVDESAGQ